MCEFIKTRESWGHEETYFDVNAFAVALAKELGGTIVDNEESKRGVIDMGDNLLLYAWHAYRKGGKWRIELHTGDDLGAGRELSHYNRPKFPSIGVDPTRSMKVLVKDIKRRLIEPSKEPLEQTKAKLADRRNEKAGVANQIKRMKQLFPSMDIRPHHDGTEATIYSGPSKGTYFNARLHSTGSITIDRIGSLTEKQANEIFKILLND